MMRTEFDMDPTITVQRGRKFRGQLESPFEDIEYDGSAMMVITGSQQYVEAMFEAAVARAEDMGEDW